MLERAADAGAKRALERIGLHDEAAVQDVRSIRQMLQDWRAVRKTVLETITRAVTVGVMALVAAGSGLAWLKSRGE